MKRLISILIAAILVLLTAAITISCSKEDCTNLDGTHWAGNAPGYSMSISFQKNTFETECPYIRSSTLHGNYVVENNNITLVFTDYDGSFLGTIENKIIKIHPSDHTITFTLIKAD